MKKLIAVSAALALFAGSAFAQEASWYGEARVYWDLASGDSDDDSDIKIFTGAVGQGILGVSRSLRTAAGIFGGVIEVSATIATPSINLGAAAFTWRPIDEVWMRFGYGYGRFDDIGRGVGITLGDFNVGVNVMSSANVIHPGAPGGYALDLTLLDGMVQWGFGIPFQGVHASDKRPEAILGRINSRVKLTLDGIGRIGLGYTGGGYINTTAAPAWRAAAGPQPVRWEIDNVSTSPTFGTLVEKPAVAAVVAGPNPVDWNLGYVRLFAYINAIENLGIDLGARYHLGVSLHSGQDAPKESEMNLFLSLGYTVSPDFGIRFRTSADLFFGDDNRKANVIGFDLGPYYHLNSIVSLGLLAGARMTMHHAEGTLKDSDMGLDWNVEPHVRVSAGGPVLRAGLTISGTNLTRVDGNVTGVLNDPKISWSVPMAVVIGF
ncbi:MAG: hypothetical protein FWE09_07235 [Treponema sp.]|nr:hypothetical protein [Treponema sp.]